MKIAFFTDSFLPRRCGVTTYILNTSQELIARGHQVLIVAPKHNKDITEKKLKEVYNLDSILVPSVTSVLYPDFRIGAPTPHSLFDVKKFNPDIIHFHTPATVGFEAVVVAKIIKKPLIATFHTYFMEPESFKLLGLKSEGRASEVLNKALWRYAARFHKPAQVVIAPTEYVAQDLKRRWKNKRIEVIPGGVNATYFQNLTNRNKLREKYQLSKNFVVLWVGRISPEKNLDILMSAFAIVFAKHPQTRLVFVGDGPMRQNLKFYCSTLCLDKAVTFIDAMSYEELAGQNYYSMGDLFVSPSTWDTQGLSMIEAMIAGLPVVAPKVKAMPKLIDKAGILVKPNDPKAMSNAIIKILKNHQLRQKYSINAAHKAQIYSVQKSVDKLLKLYQEFVK